MFFKKILFNKFTDNRGSLNKIFNNLKYFKIKQVIILNNPKKFTIRGLHWQSKPFSEKKLVFCLKGSALDIVVDMRKKSKTYLKLKVKKITEKSNFGLLVREGFAHGIFTLKKNTEIIYFSNSIYKKKLARGIRYNDRCIKLKLPSNPRYVSRQDLSWNNIV